MPEQSEGRLFAWVIVVAFVLGMAVRFGLRASGVWP